MPAIMAWNGDWSKRTDIEPLRRVVLTVLSTARADCLDEPLSGPRLLFVRIGELTVTIGFGSGFWTWQQVTGQSMVN
jgi:hypothetical protein